MIYKVVSESTLLYINMCQFIIATYISSTFCDNKNIDMATVITEIGACGHIDSETYMSNS